MKKLYIFVLSLICGTGFSQSYNASDRDPSFNQFTYPLNHFFVDTDVEKNIVGMGDKIFLITNGKVIKMDGNLVDNSFNTGTGFSSGTGGVSLWDLVELPDGKILVGGNFTTYNGIARRALLRLNADGSLDTSFTAPLSGVSNAGVKEIHVQADGKILIVGDSSLTNSGYANIFRLNANGSVDTSFVLSQNYRFKTAAIQADGRIIVNRTVLNELYTFNKIDRLNIDGSFDTTFTVASISIAASSSPIINKIYVQDDGRILVCGLFSYCAGSPSRDLARLNSTGTFDSSFSIGNGFLHSASNSSYFADYIYDIKIQADNKIVVVGDFTSFNSVARQDVVRLEQNGAIDNSFADIASFADINVIKSVSLFSDQKILISGTLNYERKYDAIMVKLNTDGTKDNSYNNIGKGFFNNPVSCISETAGGKLLVGGDFGTYNNVKCFGFTRLNQDGSIDSSLTYGGLQGFVNSSQATITAIAQQTDGKIYIGGTFLTFNGVTVKSIIRINVDGTLDTAFNAGVGFNNGTGIIKSIAINPAGGIIVAGQFDDYKGINVAGVTKVSSTGEWDGALSGESGNYYNSLKFQTDGKLLVGRNGIKRFNPGTSALDTTFLLDPSITNPTVISLAIQQDDKILICGRFTIAGVERSLVRLLSNGNLDPTFTFPVVTGTFQIKSFAQLPNQRIVISTSDQYGFNNKIFRINSTGSTDSSFSEQVVKGITNVSATAYGKILLFGSITAYQNKPARGLIRLMGQDYYFFQGSNRFDFNNNGCDVSDNLFSNVKFTATSTNPNNSFDFIANTTGNFNIAMAAGAYTISPTFENPNYFVVSPSSILLNFPTAASPQVQNFCITANGVHPDLEVTVLPINAGRPGFDAKYKVVYNNKGNQTQSGTVNLIFDDGIMDFVSAVPVISSQSSNNLNWNFTNLLPFQKGEILVTMNLNSPMETPPVNAGMQLVYTAGISSALPDDVPEDNSFTANQTVINSLDPNDKTCLEGATIETTKVGDYVHYVIRFENNGSYFAQNITVKDLIDISKYDINTLMPLNGSHLYTTRVVEGNRIEFYFENINLPYADASNDGYVAFKIKTKSTLGNGDSFSNSAAIYFDYNEAVLTNTATTTVQLLAQQDFEYSKYLVLYPNPVSNLLNIRKNEEIKIRSIRIYSVIGQLIMVVPNAENTVSIDVSSLTSGSYIVKILTDKGMSGTKFIKR